MSLIVSWSSLIEWWLCYWTVAITSDWLWLCWYRAVSRLDSGRADRGRGVVAGARFHGDSFVPKLCTQSRRSDVALLPPRVSPEQCKQLLNHSWTSVWAHSLFLQGLSITVNRLMQTDRSFHSLGCVFVYLDTHLSVCLSVEMSLKRYLLV